MELIITEKPFSERKEERNTICLNMIVKNEQKNIIQTLENLCYYFQFDYWVICDTGSTDETMTLIKDFFYYRGIPGELLEHAWQDFAHNRSIALAAAFNKTDYLLIFDADDRIIGDFILPPFPLNKDVYCLKIGKGMEWQRPLLMTNRKRWCFRGVIHEFLSNIDEMERGEETIEGDYFIAPGTVGCRSQNPNKYYDDAIILKKAFEKEMNEEKGDKQLAYRYAFYCAQSYKDASIIDESIKWYTKVILELDNWAQEKYCACLMLGNLYMHNGDMNNSIKYWLKSVEYDPERIEGIVPAMEYFRSTGDHLRVNLLYHKYKNYNKNIAVSSTSNKLFLHKIRYNDYIEYSNSISAYYVGDKESGYECCQIILANNSLSPDLIEQTKTNLNFYM